MLRGWLREDEQAVVDLEVICRDGSKRTVSAVIDTGFNGQLSLSRHLLDEIDFSVTQIGTIEMELASGDLIEEDVYSGMIRFDGKELPTEIIHSHRRRGYVHWDGFTDREGTHHQFCHARRNYSGPRLVTSIEGRSSDFAYSFWGTKTLSCHGQLVCP